MPAAGHLVDRHRRGDSHLHRSTTNSPVNGRSIRGDQDWRAGCLGRSARGSAFEAFEDDQLGWGMSEMTVFGVVGAEAVSSSGW